MSSGTTFASAATVIASEDPYLIEVVAPLESATVDAALSEIRGNVPADRATLEGLSNALDAEAVAILAEAKQVSRRWAMIFST